MRHFLLGLWGQRRRKAGGRVKGGKECSFGGGLCTGYQRNLLYQKGIVCHKITGSQGGCIGVHVVTLASLGVIEALSVLRQTRRVTIMASSVLCVALVWP